jgi:ribosomal protein S18 acetylase RimI-like enzyme
MRWRKLGRIFDPTQHALPNGCAQFAQSPQVLTFDDKIRVYFSTRAVDPRNGKFISHIAFADFQRNLRDLIGISDKTVIALGKLGTFDEHGIFPMNVLRHGDAVYGYTCGWSRRVSVSVETSIGLAISRDQGETFERVGDGPVLTASLREPCLVGDGFVKVIGGLFHMWYIFGTGWTRSSPNSPPDRTYKIGHAISKDGIAWDKEEARRIVADRLGAAESQALPTVIELSGRHHMFFCYRESFDFRTNRNRGYRIGHAFSDDLRNWTRDDENPRLDVTPGDWDSDMLCYPHVFECDGEIYLLYNGNEFGRYGFGLAILEMEPERRIGPSVVYEMNAAGVAEVAAHLQSCDTRFVPALSTRVDIDAYAQKIVDRAVRFEAWSDGALVGLVAVYANDAASGIAFITSVSVLDGWTGRGIGTRLMRDCVGHAQRHGFRKISLEVATEQRPAIGLYEKHGFGRGEMSGAVLNMHLDLEGRTG